MKNNADGMMLKPFGPSIAKVTIPEEIVKKINNYVEKIILDEKKQKELDAGPDLAGNVKQEFNLEKDFMASSGWANFLAENSFLWIKI